MLPNIDWTKKELLILAFDHRGTFLKNMFGVKEGGGTDEIKKTISDYKMIIYEGFKLALQKGVPKEIAGILVDEEYGSEVALAAKREGITFAMPCEKSGQDEFDFEYGRDFAAHIEKFAPKFIKVLVRYNPEADAAANERQAARLLELGRYLERTNQLFLFELLVPSTPGQLEKCRGDKKGYDLEMRPGLMVRAIQELQNAEVEPDVWKLEGLDRKGDYKAVCDTARSGGRTGVGCIVLGRGENEAKVREWLSVGANVDGVIGFAVGRTVFWEPLKQFKENKLNRDQAIDQISKTYTSLCNLWIEARG